MKQKRLLVIADTSTVEFFSIAGAAGLVVTDPKTEIDAVVRYIKEHRESTAGILLSAELAEPVRERLSRVQNFTVPVVQLPHSDGTSSVGFLETLMEKAVGMKLENGNFLQNTKE